MNTSPTMLYGLAVSADFPLFLRHRPPSPEASDVTFVLGPTITPTADDPEGQHLVRHEVAPGIHATHVRRPDGSYLMRFARTVDFHISADTRTITMCLAEGIDADFGSVLAMGTVLSFVLLLRGACVLHASAVEFDGQVVAFVGCSGMGKSTMAALMCADGGRLVTDDVLHVDLRPATPTCHLGATELRLRKAAAELADRFDGEVGRRTTSDLRDALALSPCPTDRLPLAAVVIPLPEPRCRAGGGDPARGHGGDAVAVALPPHRRGRRPRHPVGTVRSRGGPRRPGARLRRGRPVGSALPRGRRP